jgi:hypothetical protein
MGATLLTLVFHAVEGVSSGAPFLAGFRATFWLAGVVSGLAGLLALGTALARR